MGRRQIANFLLIMVTLVSCTSLDERSVPESPLPTSTPVESTPTPLETHIPSASPTSTQTELPTLNETPPPSPTATPSPPVATAHPIVTRVSTEDPSEALLFLRGQPQAATPHPATTPTSILFVSTRDGVADIYRMNEDGAEQIRLISNGRINQSPSWSPDGQQIAFLSSEVGTGEDMTNAHLYVMDSDGTGAVDITPFLDQTVESLTWSPDGQRIAFVVANPPPREGAFATTDVFTVNRDGSGLTQITHMEPGDVGCHSPTWSPDGSQLAFICRFLMVVKIGIARADGTDQWQDEYFGQINRLFWLPSGERIGFTGGSCSMGVMSTELLLTRGASDSGPFPCLDMDFGALEVNSAYPVEITWSPLVDTQITFQTTEILQVVDLTSNVITVARFGSQHPIDPPSWSPGGERLAFTAHDGNDLEVHVLNLASGEVLQLTDNEFDDFMPAWQP